MSLHNIATLYDQGRPWYERTSITGVESELVCSCEGLSDTACQLSCTVAWRTQPGVRG